MARLVSKPFSQSHILNLTQRDQPDRQGDPEERLPEPAGRRADGHDG